MAILQPAGSLDAQRHTETLRRALGHAVTLVEGGAGVLVLPDEGDSDGAGVQATEEPRMLHWGLDRVAAQQLVALLAEDPTPAPLDGRPRVLVKTDLWAGEIAAL